MTEKDLTLRANALAAADNGIIFEMIEKVRALTIISALKDERIKELEDAAAPKAAAD